MKYFLLATAVFAFATCASAVPRDDWQQIADALEQAGNIDAATRIRQSIDTLSDTELHAAYADSDLAGLAGLIMKKTEVINRILADSPRLQEIYSKSAQGINGGGTLPQTSIGLPDAKDYPTTGWCPTSPERSSASDVQAAQVGVDIARGLYDAAKAIWDGASRACDETLVILGEGGNASLACIPVDIVFAAIQVGIYVAETALEHVAFCDAVIDSAEIEGSYERTGHIHSDLADHQNTLLMHDNALSLHNDALTQHDAAISLQLLNHHNDMSLQLQTHDSDIKARLAVLEGKLDVLMARQLEVIRLLNTPTGQRSTDVPACNGGPCDFPDK